MMNFNGNEPTTVIILIIISIVKCMDIRGNKCNLLDESHASCKFNPDVNLNTAQIIRRHGYQSETHTIQTEDGYLLSLHRIPANKKGDKGNQPVFLQHGLLSSSADWVDAGNQSLAFLLADAGYDVWMGNARGNTYSKGHVSLPISSPTFWNFTWHEMGIYDLPAALYHVSNVTGKVREIIYVGHSMGTTMFFVFASMKPRDAGIVKFMVAMAPPVFMTHVKSPIRYLSPWVNDIEWISKYFGLNQFLPNNKIMKFLSYDCELLNVSKTICEDVIFVLCGFDKDEFNQDVLPVILSKDPAGTSTKTVLHYSQEIKFDGKFQQYDYGPKANKIHYGTLNPPQYKLVNIKVPTYLMYAVNDWLVNPIDVMKLSETLTHNVGSYQVPLEHFNHVDFLFGKDAPRVIYEPLLKVLRNYSEF